MTTRRCYESKLDDDRTVIVGYDVEGDNYLIVGKSGDFESRICLSQEAMWEVLQSYTLLLRYQAQIAPDGIGAEL